MREIAENACHQQRCEIKARRKAREVTGGEAGGKGTALLAVTDAFEFSDQQRKIPIGP